jgi:hypothetical protein
MVGEVWLDLVVGKIGEERGRGAEVNLSACETQDDLIFSATADLLIVAKRLDPSIRRHPPLTSYAAATASTGGTPST